MAAIVISQNNMEVALRMRPGVATKVIWSVPSSAKGVKVTEKTDCAWTMADLGHKRTFQSDRPMW